jgi:hypothetical protein
MYTKEPIYMSKEEILSEISILFNDKKFVAAIKEQAKEQKCSQAAMWQHFENRRVIMYGASPRFASSASFNMYKSRNDI